MFDSGTSLIYRVAGKTVLCYPLTFSASDFYLSHDLALVAASVRSDLRFLTRRWKIGHKRPTYCLLITETNLKDPQFNEILNLLSDIRMQKAGRSRSEFGALTAEKLKKFEIRHSHIKRVPNRLETSQNGDFRSDFWESETNVVEY